MIWKLQTTFSNLSSMKVFEFQLQFHWSLFPRVQLIISQHWFRQWLGTEQARNHYPNQCWPNSPMHVYTALGGNKITKSGRSFQWVLVHLVQSALLCWNSPKIFHTVFETLPVGAKSLPILPPDYWHPPRAISQNISKMWWRWKQARWKLLTVTHINSRHSGAVQWNEELMSVSLKH